MRKILNSSIRLRRDIEQSGNDLWSILKKEKKNLHEWQQVVTQIYAAALQQNQKYRR